MSGSAKNGGKSSIPIGAVAQQTGLSQHVLRIWERRYAAVEPKRRADGVRLYEEADVEKLALLRRVTESGYAIGRVAALTTSQLGELLKKAAPASPTLERSRSEANGEVAEILEAVESMNGVRVNDLLMRSLVSRGAERFVMDVLPPLLNQTGGLWQNGSICPAHEHLLSASLQRILGWTMSQLTVPVDAPVIVAATPSGQRHEMGALMCGILAASNGWRIEYLGPDLPVADIVRAATETGAIAVALSVVHRTTGDSLPTEIQALRNSLDGDVEILIGGREGWRHRNALRGIGATTLNSLEDFRDNLRERVR